MVSMGVGSGRPGLNSRATTLVPRGISLTSILFWTPKANFIEPAICLKRSTSISEKARRRTKKHISKAIKSANVAIQGANPFGGHFGHFFSIAGNAMLLLPLLFFVGYTFRLG